MLFRSGDIIVAIDGTPVDRRGTLQRIVRMKKPGDIVSVDIVRFGDKKSFRIKLAEAPNEPTVAAANDVTAPEKSGVESVSADKLGITVEPLSESFTREAGVPATVKGIHVSGVDVSSGARGKLFDSDIITEVVYPRPRRAVRTAADLQAVLSGLKAGDVITLGIYNVQQKGARVETIRIGGN